MLLPVLLFVVWLCVIVYALSLATRLVRAVERIADRLGGSGLDVREAGAD
jgi:Ca2+/H+ antiporter